MGGSGRREMRRRERGKYRGKWRGLGCGQCSGRCPDFVAAPPQLAITTARLTQSEVPYLTSGAEGGFSAVTGLRSPVWPAGCTSPHLLRLIRALITGHLPRGNQSTFFLLTMHRSPCITPPPSAHSRQHPPSPQAVKSNPPPLLSPPSPASSTVLRPVSGIVSRRSLTCAPRPVSSP